MKEEEGQQQQESFDTLHLSATLTRRDYAGMNTRRLLHEARQRYTGLQALWRVQLQLPNPDWEILASVSRQLKIFEDRCPEIFP